MRTARNKKGPLIAPDKSPISSTFFTFFPSYNKEKTKNTHSKPTINPAITGRFELHLVRSNFIDANWGNCKCSATTVIAYVVAASTKRISQLRNWHHFCQADFNRFPENERDILIISELLENRFHGSFDIFLLFSTRFQIALVLASLPIPPFLLFRHPPATSLFQGMNF